MNISLLHPADQLVMMMERIYEGGMTTTSGGNLSILDTDGSIWITPAGVDKGSLTRADIVRVLPDGRIEGVHKPSSEFPFHQRLYRARPDLRAVLHAHPPGLVAFSNIRRLPDTTLIPNISLICGKLALAEYDVPGSESLGEKIAARFVEGNDIAILENHGVVVGGTDIFKAFFAFETLEYCARIHINAVRIGKPVGLSPEKIRLSEKKQDTALPFFLPEGHSSSENAARRDMTKLILRAYRQKLFTSSQGTFSERLPDGSLLITPYGTDRAYITPEDLVLVRGGKTEEGKKPSRSLPLHLEIYAKHPEINSVIIAHPANIMAFAVTDTALESATIPESYIMLRDIPKLPFGASFMQPGLTADVFTKSTPVALVQNDCVIVTGSSLINAFDRLEVAEFTAKTIISSIQLGEIVKISEDRLREIERVFHLE